MQFPGTSIPHELLNALPYLTNLERLSLRGYPPDINPTPAKPLWIGNFEPLLRCLNLRSLDMAHTDMNITLVRPSRRLFQVNSESELLSAVSRCQQSSYALDCAPLGDSTNCTGLPMKKHCGGGKMQSGTYHCRALLSSRLVLNSEACLQLFSNSRIKTLLLCCRQMHCSQS